MESREVGTRSFRQELAATALRAALAWVILTALLVLSGGELVVALVFSVGCMVVASWAWLATGLAFNRVVKR